MTEFKAGDRIRVTNRASWGDAEVVGKVGTIQDSYQYRSGIVDYTVILDDSHNNNGMGWILYPDEMEHFDGRSRRR